MEGSVRLDGGQGSPLPGGIPQEPCGAGAFYPNSYCLPLSGSSCVTSILCPASQGRPALIPSQGCVFMLRLPRELLLLSWMSRTFHCSDVLLSCRGSCRKPYSPAGLALPEVWVFDSLGPFWLLGFVFFSVRRMESRA